MKPRIEPTVHPVAVPTLPAAPEPEPAPAPPKQAFVKPPAQAGGRRFSMLRWLFGLIFSALALLLLVLVLLRWVPPPTSAYMLQSPVHPVQQHWVPASGIAEVARRAVVASEDQKFWTHDGFDVEAIQKAYAENQKSKKGRRHPRGASTISQQTAKNLFLWPGGGYFRKGVEAALTVLIEHLWNKNRILEMYLNIVEFGPGIYGVEAASQSYFGKPAARLSAAEAARLAAVLPNPRHWSVRAPGPYVQSRANWILGQMGYGAPAAEPEPSDDEVDDDAAHAMPPPADPAADGP